MPTLCSQYHESCHPLQGNGRDINNTYMRLCSGFSSSHLRIQKDEPVSSYEMPIMVPECNVELAVVLSMLNECFNLVKDRTPRLIFSTELCMILVTNLNDQATNSFG